MTEFEQYIGMIKRHDRDLYSSDRANPGLTIRMQQSEDRQKSTEDDVKEIHAYRERKQEHNWAVILACVTAAAASLGNFIMLYVTHGK